MKLKKGFVLRQVCGKPIIMGEGLGAIDFGKLLCLNETSAWLWQEAQQMDDFTVESLSARLCEEYEVSEEKARQDVANIIEQWQQLQLII